MSTPGGTLRGLTAPSSCTVCSYMPLGRDGKKWNAWSTDSDDMAFHIWTCRQMSLPSRQWGPGPAGKKAGACITKYTSSIDYQGPHHMGQNGQMSWLGMWCPPWKTAWGGKGASHQGDWESPKPADVQPPWGKTPRRRRRDASAERDLAEVREAHWRALAAVATLEESIERLSWSITRGQLDAHAHSWSSHCCRRRSHGWSRRHCRALLEDSSVSSPTHSPPQWGPGVSENKEAEPPFLEFNLQPPPELGPDIDHFLQEPANGSREDNERDSSPDLPVEEYERWVIWRGMGAWYA